MSIIKKLFEYTDTISFEIIGDEKLAIDKLKNTCKPALQAIHSESEDPLLTGSVSKEDVRLYKVTPLFWNYYKPIFFGRFDAHDNKTFLVGKFKIGFVGRVTTIIFLCFCLGIQILLLPLIGTKTGLENLWIFSPLMLGIILIIDILISKKIRSRDIGWIKNQIETALKNFN